MFTFIILLIIFQKDEVYLNLVLEYIPDTVYKVARHYSKLRQTIPISYIKVCISLNLVNIISMNVMIINLFYSYTCISYSEVWHIFTH